MRALKTSIALSTSMLLAALFAWISAPRATAQSPALTIEAVSARPDMVTGGDVLLELKGAGSVTNGVAVTVNGRDVSRAFAADPTRGSLIGLVDGLRIGANTIEARSNGKTARLTITNFPITGPVFSGPHLD